MMCAKLQFLDCFDAFNAEVKILQSLDNLIWEEQIEARETLSGQKLLGNMTLNFHQKLLEISFEIMLQKLKYDTYRQTFKRMRPLPESLLHELTELSDITQKLLEKYRILKNSWIQFKTGMNHSTYNTSPLR